jgi:hypothetical protein
MAPVSISHSGRCTDDSLNAMSGQLSVEVPSVEICLLLKTWRPEMENIEESC